WLVGTPTDPVWAYLREPVKVLLLSPFFFPEAISTGKYNTVLAEALGKVAAEIKVITSHPFYPGWKPRYSSTALAKVSVVRGGLWIRYPSGMTLRRLVLECWYALHVWLTLWRERWSPDIVI